MKLRYDKKRQKLILTEATRTEYHQVKIGLTKKVKGYQFTPTYKMNIWDGNISHFDDGEFDLGLWKEVYTMCKQNGWKFELENKEDFPMNKKITYEQVNEFCKDFFKDHTLPDGKEFTPYEHQIDSAFKIMKNRYCLTEVATGGGKSLIFAIIAFYILREVNPKAKFLLIVPNISLVTQFYDDITDYNHGFKNGGQNENALDINMCEIMSDKPRRDEGEANIVIGTVQSLEKRLAKKEFKGWFEQFNIVATDESHKAGNGAKASGIKQIKKVIKRTVGTAYMRFGMSGTYPEEGSLDWLTVQSLHGPKIAEVQAKKLMEQGIISTVKIKSLLLNHNNPNFNNQLNMIKGGGNAKACYDLEKNYIHESEPRLNFITDKILSKIKKNSLVLFNIKDYGKNIFKKIRDEVPNVDVYYIDGDTKKDKREFIKAKMDNIGRRGKIGKILGDDTIKDRPKVLVASFGTLSTGVSIKNLHNVVFMESFKSEQVIIQSIGRILRLHKDKDRATVFDIVDIFDGETRKKNILYKHYEVRKAFYEKREYPMEELKIILKNKFDL